MGDYKIGKYDIEDVHDVMERMMADIDRICRENSISYILDGGTMLGAVRHQGFIPWDDDLDIAMTRDDYERFLKIANTSLSEEYRFECIENNKNYPYNFGKVRAVNTLYVEDFTEKLKINHGVYIDVFPMDYVDERDTRKLIRVRKMILHLTQLRYSKLGICNGIKYIPFKLLPLAFINQLISALMKYNYRNRGDKVQKLCHCGAYGENKPVIEKTIFTNTIRVPFGGHYFNIPKEYDSFLIGRYGDYMKLPSVDKQKPCHDIKEIKL